MRKDMLLAVGKIIEGATRGDQQKVAAYALQLSDKLEAAGEVSQAKKIRKIVQGTTAGKFELALMKGNLVQEAAHRLPTDSDSRLPTADEEFFQPDEVVLFLSSEVQRLVDHFLTYFRAADRLHAKGVGITASMLIYGPPGCGKTQMAKWLAAQLALPLVTARMDGLISSYLGSTAKNIRQLFDHAMSRPCVLFLDEFDALAKMRDDTRELGELKRVVISLLQNIDTMSRDHVLVAATNHEHLLDKAIWRRFAYHVHLTEPDEETRRRMITKFLGSYGTDETVSALHALSAGLTGAQLRHIADESIRAAVLSDQDGVSLRDVTRITLANHPQVSGDHALSVPEQARKLYQLNPRVFTQVRLSSILGVSQPQVSRYLREGTDAGG